MIVDEPYSSRETVSYIRPADRESTSPELQACPTVGDRQRIRQIW